MHRVPISRLFVNASRMITKTGALKVHHSTQNKLKLVEVGLLNEPKVGSYSTGQIFLHKLFGYRGIILFPWTACIFDKQDDSHSHSDHNTISSAQYDKVASEELDKPGPIKNLANKLSYYQVLIDNRDIPYIRSQPESVTFLSGPKANRSVYSIQGLDYVSHHDVLPYTSSEKVPIVHDLFDKFLMRDPEDAEMTKSTFVARESLRAWQDSNQPWLELSDVYKRTTNNIRVTVIPFYIGVKEENERKKLYWWRYSIRIENLSHKPVTLRERHWRIFSQAGTFETVRGKGVIGQEPQLTINNSVFQYSSHVNLQAPSGHMWGTFKMERADGSNFEVRIPSFYLESKDEDSST